MSTHTGLALRGRDSGRPATVVVSEDGPGQLLEVSFTHQVGVREFGHRVGNVGKIRRRCSSAPLLPF